MKTDNQSPIKIAVPETLFTRLNAKIKELGLEHKVEIFVIDLETLKNQGLNADVLICDELKLNPFPNENRKPKRSKKIYR